MVSSSRRSTIEVQNHDEIPGGKRSWHSQVNQATRQALTETIVIRKVEKNLSFQNLADGTGLSVAYVTAALLGQHPLQENVARKVAAKLDLDEATIRLLQTVPVRGSITDHVPTDPTIYRFFEIVQVYGTTLKALIAEQFGDGYISSINLRLDVNKVEDPEGGHRAVITLNGKYMPALSF
jgi:cyanate lyase